MTTPWTARRVGGCVARLGVGAFIVYVVAYAVLSLLLNFNAPSQRAVTVPTSWTSHEVVLTADRPSAHGQITFTLPGQVTKPAAALGVNAGVPASTKTSTRSPAPAALLSIPAVRLTAVGSSGASMSCLAPCELPLSSAGSRAIDLTIDLLAPTAGAAPVTITVSGGASASVGGDVPGVELTIDGVAPGGGG